MGTSGRNTIIESNHTALCGPIHSVLVLSPRALETSFPSFWTFPLWSIGGWREGEGGGGKFCLVLDIVYVLVEPRERLWIYLVASRRRTERTEEDP